MEGSKEESGLERYSTSRPLNAGGSIAALSSNLGLRDSSTSREVEVDEDTGRPKNVDFDTRLKAVAGGSSQNQGEVSLRDWLDKPGRSMDFLECLHIFRQVVQAVNLSHSQRVVVNNIIPSCFVMSTFNSVSFVESVSCSGLASERMSAGAFESSTHSAQLSLVEELEERRDLDLLDDVEERRDFSSKHKFNLECNWYECPEEGQEMQSVYASDVYRLGVLLFELFCTFDTLEEKIAMMSNLRHRVLPPQMLLKWPKVASFCLWLLHPQPSSRPKVSEVLQSEFLNTKRSGLEEREVAIKLKEEIESHGLLLEFILQLQRRKQETADMLHDTILFLSRDIEEVESQRLLLMKRDNFFEMEKGGHGADDKFKNTLPPYEINEDSASSASRKRIRPECKDVSDINLDTSLCGDSGLDANLESQEKITSRNSRIMNNFKRLEAAYFSCRCNPAKPAGQLSSRKLLVPNTARGSTAKTEGSSVDDLIYKEGEDGSRMGEWINPFLDGLCKYLSFSKFIVLAELKQGDLLHSSNLICSLAFDRDKHFFATVGVNRKIKVFECDAIINDDRDIHYPVVELPSRSKLSNVCWNAYIKNQMASSDFDGAVQVWDVTRSQVLVELREHEKRVWSVDYLLTNPAVLASGSDDGTVKLWNINQGGSTSTIRTKANVCSVQFSPDSSRMIAIGSADHNVYCYDLRNTRIPLCTLVGHAKTVSYVKFVDSSTLVSSSTDNSLKLWDLSASTLRVLDTPTRTFAGHTNVKNFVGLSVSDGYIATGSETNEIFVYQKAFPMPVFSYNFGCLDPISGLEEGNINQFISCVCWRGQSHTLVAANSSGNIKILEMV